jgi:hypothetical protein
LSPFLQKYAVKSPILLRAVIQALAFKTMKIILLSITLFLLQACVGASYMTSHEGLHFDSESNEYRKPPEFKSFANGYSSENEADPGNLFQLKSENLEIVSNCYKERIVSIFPAFVIPLPPLIPLFGSGSGSTRQTIGLTINGSNQHQYEIVSIRTSGVTYQPVKIHDSNYKFELVCNSLNENSVVVVKGIKGTFEIKLEFIKTYNIGWGWLSA